MQTANTHRALSARLCGTPLLLAKGAAEVELETIDEMRADESGLVHGGFVFGLADHAAMLAINEPNVVLGSAEVRFLAPVRVGERLTATARLLALEGKRHRVEVHVNASSHARGASAPPGGGAVDASAGGAAITPEGRREERVFEGTFVCFVPAQHVLAARSGGDQ
jgi:acyl-coenzyme A thioesterase PaaI-like protein